VLRARSRLGGVQLGPEAIGEVLDLAQLCDEIGVFRHALIIPRRYAPG
jgi:hypothetical protein